MCGPPDILDPAHVRSALIADADYENMALERVSASRGRKIGVFCSSDHFVMKLYKAARERGLRPPEDFGLMGFDGADMLHYLDRRITTLDYPAEKIGEMSAQCLCAMMDGSGDPNGRVLDCPVLPGDTV